MGDACDDPVCVEVGVERPAAGVCAVCEDLGIGSVYGEGCLYVGVAGEVVEVCDGHVGESEDGDRAVEECH